MCKKKVFARLWSFDCEKSFVHAICEKYMVQVITYAFVSLSSVFPLFISFHNKWLNLSCWRKPNNYMFC